MDIGIDGLLGKCEEYFGKGVTKCFVGLIMMAVAVVAVHYIYSEFLVPLYSFLVTLIQTGIAIPIHVSNVVAAVGTGFLTFLITSIGSSFAFYQYKRTIRELEEERAEIAKAIHELHGHSTRAVASIVSPDKSKR